MTTTSKSATAPPRPDASATINVVLLPTTTTPDHATGRDREQKRVGPCVRARTSEADTLGLSTRRRVRAFVAQQYSPRERQREYPIEAVSTQRVPHAAMDRRLRGLHGPDGAAGSRRLVRASKAASRGAQGYSRGSEGVLTGYSRGSEGHTRVLEGDSRGTRGGAQSGIQMALKVVNGVLNGTRGALKGT
jgi:hypothetical protein